MHAQSRLSPGQRRGVVLVLVLAMLGLLALIGVTFATISGQAKVGSNFYAQAIAFPQAEAVFDFALDQVINDTNNPASAIRGHGLKRDMYGNDSTAWGYSQEIGCFLDTVPFVGAPSLNFSALQFQAVGPYTGGNGFFLANAALYPQYRVNIPIATAGTGATYGLNFRRWILRLAGTVNAAGQQSSVAQTFEILEDDDTGSLGTSQDPVSGYRMHMFVLSPMDSSTALQNVALGTTIAAGTAIGEVIPPQTGATVAIQSQGPFTLDGRFLRAFNGTGLANFPYPSATAPNPIIPTAAAYGNFLFNGIGNVFGAGPGSIGDPNFVGMDEDYDAADLENWFMALQSADGTVSIPSFHRPGILGYEVNKTNGAVVYDDWTNLTATTALSRSKILRRRQIDMAAGFPADPRPNVKTGKITYDVDNDGDGTTDSVWLDLGYPVQTDSSGKSFKPMFAFTVLGLNGRLPLNTAGNLQGRQLSSLTDVTFPSPYPTPYAVGDPTFYHTSHLGSSTSEINPAYYFMSATDSLGAIPLQRILTGTRNPASGDPIAGRWGEPELIPPLTAPAATPPVALTYGAGVLNNPVRAGRSYPAIDARDADYDALDFYPTTFPAITPTAVTPTRFPEQSDFFDPSGSFQLPSERRRRFVTPDDPTGTGRVVVYNFNASATDPTVATLPAAFTYPYFLTPPSTLLSPPMDFGTGADNNGRVSFFMYFRPPGLPTNLVWPSGVNGPPIPDVTTNLTHGFEAARNPAGTLFYPAAPTPSVDSLPYWSGAAPWNVLSVPPTITPPDFLPTRTPTFDTTINSSRPSGLAPSTVATLSAPSGVANYGLYPPSSRVNPVYQAATQGTLMMNEADQMNVYHPTQYDAPFGPSDLEWLYRKHDVDGTSLGSRLSLLAPTVFNTSNVTGSRLFTTETWDRNNFVWAADNPGGVFSHNAVFPNTGTLGDPRTYGLSSASLDSKSAIFSAALGTPFVIPTPSVMHRDKKINLNYPLPIQATGSGGSMEPVRQKWIRETYTALRHILPPKSVDTPEELAALSQFVINIVDFRDPDGVVTQWSNPEIAVTPATTTSPPIYRFAPFAGAVPVTQFGMEYQPLALNEVLAMTFKGKSTTSTSMDVPRMFIEVVNMLTRDGGPTTGPVPSRAEDLALLLPAAAAQPGKMVGWKLAIGSDDPTGRPDPITGQFSPLTLVTTPWTIDLSTGTPTNIRSMSVNGPPVVTPNTYYYVISNTLPTTVPVAENVPPAGVECPALPTSFFPGTGTPPPLVPGNYYWLYLTRPADPMDTTSPDVVVDAFRFPYSDGSAGMTFTTSGMGTDSSTGTASQPLYSLQRRQPYRGGHNVPIGTLPQYKPVDAYGYSEQTNPPAVPIVVTATGATTYNGFYGSATVNIPSTMNIPHTLGAANAGADANWEYFPFYDRDFTSVAELMLVPGCPPGLFTKKFLELPPSYDGFDPRPPHVLPPTTVPTPTPIGLPPSVMEPGEARFGANTDVVFPYLRDEFYYTADGTSTYDDNPVPAVDRPIKGTTPTPVIGWTTGVGWHKIFDFFEVPSNAFGSTGPVAQGQNFDWARDDRRPGQINLNLIIDEEVFLGLIDDPRMNAAPMLSTGPPGTPLLPQVVTQVDSTGRPTVAAATGPSDGAGFYNVGNRGYLGQFSSAAAASASTFPMHQAFADFLKLRHGGSGFLFAWGSGAVNSMEGGVPVNNPPIPVDTRVAAERPFHSPSFPDINYTIMRPATLPPSVYTRYLDVNQQTDPPTTQPVIVPNLTNFIAPSNNLPWGFGQGPTAAVTNGSTTMAVQPTMPGPPPALLTEPAPWVVMMDPGLRNPYLYDPNNAAYPNYDLPPARPARRLFQIPDMTNFRYYAATQRFYQYPYAGDLTFRGIGRENAAEGGDWRVNQPTWNANLALGHTDLIDSTVFDPASPAVGTQIPFRLTVPDVANTYTIPVGYSNLLGGFNYPYTMNTTTPPGPSPTDNRQHPYFRNEMMTKMMNLSTVRTHQYAVWVTVGFFEVVRPGNKQMATVDPTQVPDIIGAELGLNAGTNIRYRAFAIIDRSLATGYNPSDPGDFRDVITYRRRIE
jgi:large repetitive protein